MLKSYGGDFDIAARLVTSFSAHNVEFLPLDIVVPPEDVEKFSIFLSDQISVISEDTIPTRFAVNQVNGIRPGYINQEIVKLAFHRLKRFEAYLCLDSDAIFLRDFFSMTLSRPTDFHTRFSLTTRSWPQIGFIARRIG